MKITTKLKQDTFQVRESCSLCISLTCSEDLVSGDTVEFYFPHSWSLVCGPSFTREFQCNDPVEEHYIGVSADGALFEIEIKNQHQYTPQGICRHGRLFVATLRDGRVSAGALIQVKYANTFAPYVAETEEIGLRV